MRCFIFTKKASRALLVFFSPDHFVDYSDVALDDLDNFGADIFVGVVGYGGAVIAVTDEFHCCVNALEQTFGVDAAQHETGLVKGLGAFGAGAYADGGERMAYAGEEAGLLGEGAAIRHHSERIHLQAVVVVETQGLLYLHAGVELEA